MPTIDVNLDGDNAWPDLSTREVLHLPGVTWKIATLEAGMSSGAPSVALRIDYRDEHDSPSSVVVETSLAAWIAATCAMRGRFPEVFAGSPLAAPDVGDA